MQGPPTFLLSPPRSGSTLLARILGAHSNVHAPNELHLLQPLYHLGYFGVVDSVGKGFTEDPNYHPEIVASAARDVVRQLPRGEADYLDALRAYTDTIYQRLLAASGKRVLIDKSPMYLRYADFLMKLYPSAPMICLTRHPLAVGTSFNHMSSDLGLWKELLPEQLFALYADRDTAAFVRRSMRIFAAGMTRALRNDRLTKIHVKYEDVVANPTATMARICAFLDLPFEPDMIHYGKHAPVAPQGQLLGDPYVVHNHDRPVDGYQQKWMKTLAERKDGREFAHDILGCFTDDDLDAWGYDRATIVKEIDSIPSGAGNGHDATTD